ncbi:hypothetical protein HanRHA438_Chr17g0836781 [Helianthus annuus]|nr:hypothetical protein HanRHA438_Chr17g0836781 [Helianthus annuus]
MNRLNISPLITTLDLQQPAHFILDQYGQHPRVGVGGQPHREIRLRTWRVIMGHTRPPFQTRQFLQFVTFYPQSVT